MSGFAGLQSAIGAAVGNINLPGAFSSSAQPNPKNTTTAVNMAIVSKGIVQGLIRSLNVDENFNVQRVKAIGSAISVAMIPGVYEATATISKAFIFGQSLESALGGGIRPVVGLYQASPDFTQFYFNIVLLDNNNQMLGAYHDCVLTTLRRAVEIEGVIIMDDASLMCRWSDVNA
jgi:hypothetical protein